MISQFLLFCFLIGCASFFGYEIITHLRYGFDGAYERYITRNSAFFKRHGVKYDVSDYSTLLVAYYVSFFGCAAFLLLMLIQK